jgi:SnoaL-like domain
MAREDRLRAMYESFNARAVDAVVAHMALDVDWPNAWEGGRVRGHEAVRDYWMRQWAVIDPVLTPLAFTPRGPDRVAVEVRQRVRDIQGAMIADGRALHVYRFQGDLITAMDVEDMASAD